MDARWLHPEDEHALDELLLERPVSNLFLIALADGGLTPRTWAGAFEGERLLGVAAVIGGLVVPAESIAGSGDLLGPLLRERSPTLLVGASEPADGLLAHLPPPTRCNDQRLYVCDTVPSGEGTIERARPDEAEQLAELADAMNREDIGRGFEDHQAHLAAVRQRIEAGRVWVARDAGQVVFTVNVGTRHGYGCQIGGTYVLPDRRGEGFASRGLSALLRHLLAQHPRVTLHVDERNAPAVRLYERTGFRADAAFRLATWSTR